MLQLYEIGLEALKIDNFIIMLNCCLITIIMLNNENTMHAQ